MDSSTYRQLAGELQKNCFIPHYNFPSHNILSVETLSEVSKGLEKDELELSSDFPFYQPFPYDVQQSSVLFFGSCTTDNARQLVKRKLNWETELKNLRVSNIDAAVKSIKRLRENKGVKLSNNLKKYIEHFHCDPEPVFTGNYNWLYTGGCLSLDEKSNEMHLITSDCNFNKPGFNLLQLSKTSKKILQKSFSQLKAYSPVLQITCKPHAEKLIIGVRQKNYLSLFNANRMNSLSQPVKLWRKKVSGSKLLTCVDVEASCEKVVITDSSHDINVFNIERKNKIYAYPGRDIISRFTGDAWSQVGFGDHGVYLAHRNCFLIFDLRDFYVASTLDFQFSPSTYSCEKICVFTKSQSNTNFVYLGTTHSILQVDLRSQKVVQKWTHLMRNPPQFLATVKDKDESEVLLLHSSSIDEIMGITVDRDEARGNDNFVSKSLPCILKSIKETLNLARLRGMCLSPSMAKRIDFSVTGMQCMKNNQDDIDLFITNSGGDVFLNKVKNKVSESSLADENLQESIEKMKLYESHLEKLSKKSLRSNVESVDMSRVLLDCHNSKLRTPKEEIYWKYHEMYSLESLKLFQDFFAQKILDIWIPSESRPEDQDMEAEMKSIEAKVLEWMANW